MQPARLELEKVHSSNGDHLVTRLKGSLSLETLHDFIEKMRAEPASHPIFDLSGVSFMDSVGVGGTGLVVRHPS